MKPGEVFLDKYNVLEILGTGGMGTVYKMQHITLGTIWVVKEVQIEDKNKRDIYAEIEVLKKLNHSSLPKIFDVCEDDKYVYIIMEYISGDTLEVVLNNTILDEQTVIDYSMQICKVLAYLHSHRPNPIIYRDMKPSNVIVSKDGSLKLIDFGTAREFKQGGICDTVLLGTRGYAAPEQFGRGQSGTYTDIYSLGVTMHYMATGKNPCLPPYEFVSPKSLNNNISKELDSIIMKCIERLSENRFSNAEELYEELSMLCKNKDITIVKTITCAYQKQQFIVIRNFEFACELALALTKANELRVVILEDSNFFDKCAYYLGVSEDKEYLDSNDTLKARNTSYRNLYYYNISTISDEGIRNINNSLKELFDYVIIYRDSIDKDQRSRDLLRVASSIIYCEDFSLLGLHIRAFESNQLSEFFNLEGIKFKLVQWSFITNECDFFFSKSLFERGSYLGVIERTNMVNSALNLEPGSALKVYSKYASNYEKVLKNLQVPIKKSRSLNFFSKISRR